MALKTEQVEEIIYKPRSILTCDAPGCESRIELQEASLWWRLNLVNSAAFGAQEFHLCSLPCLARWSVEAASRA